MAAALIDSGLSTSIRRLLLLSVIQVPLSFQSICAFDIIGSVTRMTSESLVYLVNILFAYVLSTFSKVLQPAA